MFNKVLQFGAGYKVNRQSVLILVYIRGKYITIAFQRYRGHLKRFASLRERVVSILKITGFFFGKKNPLGTG